MGLSDCKPNSRFILTQLNIFTSCLSTTIHLDVQWVQGLCVSSQSSLLSISFLASANRWLAVTGSFFQTNMENQNNLSLTNDWRPLCWCETSQEWGVSCSPCIAPPPTSLGGESCLLHPAQCMWGRLCWTCLHPTSGQTPGKPGVLVTSHSLIRKQLQFRFRGSEVTLGEGRFSSGHDGICRACLEKPRKWAEAGGSGVEDVHLLWTQHRQQHKP